MEPFEVGLAQLVNEMMADKDAADRHANPMIWLMALNDELSAGQSKFGLIISVDSNVLKVFLNGNLLVEYAAGGGIVNFRFTGKAKSTDVLKSEDDFRGHLRALAAVSIVNQGTQ
jgi:hypothetical protein